MTATAIHICEARTFNAGDPQPDGYIDRVEWHKTQRRAGLRQARCECGLWLYPFQPHACAASPLPGGKEER